MDCSATIDAVRKFAPGSSPKRRFSETLAFAAVLALVIAGFFHESLFGGKILSPADVLLVEASFRGPGGADYEPANRLLMDPVLQFQPWLELNRSMIRQGRLPLWNGLAGCGAPHLANGQSAVFDPFHLLAYVGTVAGSLGWMAAGRLWVSGLGMFLLGRAWGLGPWGRWFAGLTFPFSGFLVAWLLYPVTPVAIWMPWLFLASDRVLSRPGGTSIVSVAIATALLILGGHVQTGAHVLLGVGLFALWKVRSIGLGRGIFAWGSGIVLGLALAAVQIVPLADYLTESPVWSDRQRELIPWWTLSKPRILDSLCTALPYAYGSQRRGQPNLARALGVHNLNESSGGFVGLPTLVLLVPLAWKILRRRKDDASLEVSGRTSVGPFLVGLAAVGFLGAYRLPPVDNVLRILPVLNVTDNRRLGLWVAFALTMLGGIGLDALRGGLTPGPRWTWAMVLGALALFVAAGTILASEPTLRRRAEAHYRQAADRSEDSDREVYRRRAERQVRETVEFLPRYYALHGLELLLIAGLVWAARRQPRSTWRVPAAVVVLSLLDLGSFGLGLNPAIDRAIQEAEPPVISTLRRELKPGERAIGVGEELPPNVLMRSGIGDPRNYDSVELTRNLDWLAPLYGEGTREPEARTSRRTIGWRDVARARGRLEEAGVAAAVGGTAPPPGLFEAVEKVGEVWVARLAARPWAEWVESGRKAAFSRDHGRAEIVREDVHGGMLIVRETWDEGWVARVDGKAIPVVAHQNTFLEIRIPENAHSIVLSYEPASVRLGLAATVAAAAAALGILALTGFRRS